MQSIKISSPAKLNLYLRVLGRRRDGYHRLLTLFHRISLKDTLYLTKKKSGFSLRTDHSDLPTDERNLITRAYGSLCRYDPALGGVSVRLIKRIPLGAGLGGGSSNAAAFLLGMKQLYRLRISKKELMKIARQLGADVPFFLENITQAIALGRGDKIYPRPSRRRFYFLLVYDFKGLSTKKVYKSLGRIPRPASLTKENHAVRMLCHFLDRQDLQRVRENLRNDLEKPAFCLKPSIFRKKVRLEKIGLKAVRMSGSGPTLFTVFRNQREIGPFLRKIRRIFPHPEIAVARSF